MSDPKSLQEQLDAARAEIEALRTKAVGNITPKVGEKGNLLIYGLQRFPYAFYINQWDRLMAKLPEIVAYVEANRDRFTKK